MQTIAQQQNQSALAIAKALEENEKVSWVYYPGLTSHPSHEIASKQMHGFGGLVSFELSGGLNKVEEFIQALEIPQIAPSLGGVETLVSHPASMVYYDLSDEQLEDMGFFDNMEMKFDPTAATDDSKVYGRE